MLRLQRGFVAAATLSASPMTSLAASTPAVQQQFRPITCDKSKNGNLVRIDKRMWRIASISKSQKGQGSASYNLKLTELGTGKKKEMNALPPSYDLPEVRYQRVKLLFSGYDDEDNACFVYPQTSSQAGEEVNIPASSLSEQHQKFLCVGMPVDYMHILADEEADVKEQWLELVVPTTYEYTVENLQMKGMYKMAVLNECDGLVSVTDNIQPGDRIKVTIRPDGTTSFGGKIS